MKSCLQATDHLEAFIADCDRRTTAAKQRLAETQEELSQEVNEKANAVHELAEAIGQKLARAEALGEEGMVEESVMLMGEVSYYKHVATCGITHVVSMETMKRYFYTVKTDLRTSIIDKKYSMR